MKTVICKMQERGETACLKTGYNLWHTVARFFVPVKNEASEDLCMRDEEPGRKERTWSMWERETESLWLSCARAWDGRKVGREEWDMTLSLRRDILLQAKQIRHIIRYRRPSNDSNKPNKNTMQLEERECLPESLREKQMKVKGGGLHTRNRKSKEFVRLSLLWIHTI